MYQGSSSSSSSPLQSMIEEAGPLIVTSNGLSRLNNESSNSSTPSLTITVSDKNGLNSNIHHLKNNNHTTSLLKKNPFRRGYGNNCEIQTDDVILKMIPYLHERYIEVVDSVTKEPCNMLMCLACRCLLKKNTDVLLGHLCKQKDVEKFLSIPILNNQLIFRCKPKNRATPIWDEFEEVIEPATNLLLGYARCKRCLDIIKTSDPKSIPAVLRRHIPVCASGPFPPTLMVTSFKCENTIINGASKNNNSNNGLLNDTLNLNTSAHNINTVMNELSNNNSNFASKNLNNNHQKVTNGNNINNNLASNTITIHPIGNLSNSNTNSLPVNTSNSGSLIAPSSSKINHWRTEFRDRCIEFCCSELVSIDSLRSSSFKRLGQTLMVLGTLCNRHPQLPDTSQLYGQMYTQYSTLRFQLKNDLQLELFKNIGGALVCDSQDDLCVLTTYYINNNWKLKEIVLSATTSGSDINSFITNTLNDYHLNEEDKLSKFTFVSRGGLFDGVNICLTSIAHTIDHIIETTIFYDDTYTDVIENCRLICNDLGIEVKLEALVENVDWITKYEIMRHVLINIEKYELRNSTLNFDLVKFLVYLLTPFKNASYELRQCSTHPTLNHVLLWYYKIMKVLESDEKCTPSKKKIPLIKIEDEDEDEFSDQNIIMMTKKSIRDAMEQYFQLHSLHKIAAFLWPNFRTLKMLTPEERKEVHNEVYHLIETRISINENEKKVDYTGVPSKPKKARTDFSDWEEDSGPIVNQDEIDRYLNDKLPPCDESSVLNWWKDHQIKFPKLAQLAKWILSIPASVTSLEKYKLHNSPKIDEEILFLHCNLFDKQQSKLD